MIRTFKVDNQVHAGFAMSFNKDVITLCDLSLWHGDIKDTSDEIPHVHQITCTQCLEKIKAIKDITGYPTRDTFNNSTKSNLIYECIQSEGGSPEANLSFD